MKDDTLQIAVIGAGPVACTRHLPALARIANVTVAGLCDRNEERLRETGAACGIPAERQFTDHRRMLDIVRPDAVYAIMPPHHVVDLALEIMDRGHALFIEKPPGISSDQAGELARMAVRRGVVSAVAFQRRFHPVLRACWERTRREAPLHRVRVNYHKWSPPSKGQPYYGGIVDILHCDAIHAVDAARYYAGLSEVREVRSLVRRIGAPFPNCFQALVTFENGVVASIDADWSSGRRFFTFEFHAPGACAYVDIDRRGTVWADNAERPVLDRACEAGDDPAALLEQGGFLAENRAFVEAVRSGRPPHNCLSDALRSMQLADAILDGGGDEH